MGVAPVVQRITLDRRNRAQRGATIFFPQEQLAITSSGHGGACEGRVKAIHKNVLRGARRSLEGFA